MRSDDVRPGCGAVDKIINFRDRAVKDRDGETVVIHIQNEVLAHHGQADQAEVSFCCGIRH